MYKISKIYHGNIMMFTNIFCSMIFTVNYIAFLQYASQRHANLIEFQPLSVPPLISAFNNDTLKIYYQTLYFELQPPFGKNKV